jgi:hypothetical protein
MELSCPRCDVLVPIALEGPQISGTHYTATCQNCHCYFYGVLVAPVPPPPSSEDED